MPFPVSNIREVCKERKTSLAEIERTLKIGNGVIAKWEYAKTSPPYDRILDIANLLDVPVSRLTGAASFITEDGLQDLKDDERVLLEHYRTMTEEDREMMRDLARRLKNGD